LQKPVLLITCRVGNEDWCIEEIGNVLFQKDPEVNVVKTRYPGLLLVYSNLNVEKAYKQALSYEYGFVENIIPVHYMINFNESIPNDILNLLEPNSRVKVKVRLRGLRGYSSIIWKRIIEILKTKNIVHSPDSNICLYVEGVDDIIYIGKGLCRLPKLKVNLQSS